MLTRSTLLLLAAVAMLGGVVAAPNPGHVTAQYAFRGPSSIDGTFEGYCQAVGILYARDAPGSMDLVIEGGELIRKWTRVNLTIVDPNGGRWVVDNPDRQWKTIEALPAGNVRHEWPTRGQVVAYSSLPTDPQATAVPIQYSASALRVDPVASGPRTPAWWDVDADGKPFLPYVSGFSGWNRAVTHAGHAAGNGNVTLYLREVAIDAPGTRVEPQPFFNVESNVSTTWAEQKTVVYADAFLRLKGAQFDVRQGDTAVCRSLEGRLTGSYAAGTATGEAKSGEETVTFDERVLTLEGSFQLDETPSKGPFGPDETPRVEAEAAGAIRVVGVDFQTATVAHEAVPVRTLGWFALAVAALAMIAKSYGSLLSFFYSRLPRDRVLDSSNRDVIYSAIRESPGLAVKDLRALTGLHWDTVIYHVETLRRAGLVSTSGSMFARKLYYAKEAGALSPSQLALAAEPRLAFVRDRLQPGPMALGELVAAVQERFGVGGRAGYRLVEKGLRAGLLKAERVGAAKVVALAD